MDFVHRGREDLVNYLFSAKVNIARACVGNSQFLELEYI
ncbi:hypothetical protein T08_13881 [Trichinella sp. T8]|nr:hypothetical protein T08_13881 [Trichinella sp. T8]